MRLVALDIETTGLNPSEGHILEVGVITFEVRRDENFCADAMFDGIIRPTPIWVLESLDPVIEKMHTDNGLLRDIKLLGKRRHEVELELMKFLEQYPETKGTPLVGHNVWFDKAFLRVHMPQVAAWFSHRSLDTSAMTELAKLNATDTYPKSPPKHRAVEDALYAMMELNYYRRNGILPG